MVYSSAIGQDLSPAEECGVRWGRGYPHLRAFSGRKSEGLA